MKWIDRREFIGTTALAAAGASALAGGCATASGGGQAKLLGALLHLGMNMWGDYRAPSEAKDPTLKYTHDHLRMDEPVWNDITALMQKRRYNFAIIDVGEGVVFPSHPELAVKGSWTPDRLRDEVARLKEMGIEAIPKLNFSCCHNRWMGVYSRMVSTRKYYQVVDELIGDVCEIFGKPRYVHLGMDEETERMQKTMGLVVVRRGELLWHDVNYLFKCVEKRGARPIVFGTSFARQSGDEFFKRMPKSAVINYGMYGHGYDLKRLTDTSLPVKERNPLGYGQWFNDVMSKELANLERLSKDGYDFLSCTSNWTWNLGPDGKPKSYGTGKDHVQDAESAKWQYDYITARYDPKHVLGFVMMPWASLQKGNQYYWECGINQMADAVEMEK